ncbi:DNA topoisomerase I eukaryotic-type [Arabidopsis thaliana x Arabidopsis arenosa]|uniref:DNA topoisomerase 1 n=1 Tax=Arabidopsis thaliana x Arabidopsis arenosa TaxID=1240361 RepID=A0A8T1Y2S4_9BRAS|nr:DNA topoisomerase I eukaryotic-type [Arabidopsis thaliana x Arabidopsis arenosa]
MATEAAHDGHSDDGDDKPIVFKRSDNGDSEDDRPLSSIFFKNSPLDRPSEIIKDESDDDEAPISSRFRKKKGNGVSGSKQDSTDENKPLVNKWQNGSTHENEGPSPKVSGKRPLEKGSSADQSSVKKPKVSSSSTSVAMKSLKIVKQGDKRKVEVDHEDDDDDVPIAKRMNSDSSKYKTPSAKPKVVKQSSTSSATKSKMKRVVSPPSKTRSKKSKKLMNESKFAKSSKTLPTGDGKKKWTTLVHNGVIFPPLYKPHGVQILYKGKPVNLTPEQEEVATMFAVMRETDFYNKPLFRENFWNDWRKLLGKNHEIQKLDDCDFTPIYDWHLEEKKKKKAPREKGEKYMWAVVDGVKEKVGNFRVEPPGLFRGRGEHPKTGKLKKRIHPCDITLNIGKDAPIPECPIPGERWKEVKHDNMVTWLAFWNDPINPKRFKYVSLSASSSQKGQSDKNKYEKARNLKDHIENIRATYTKNFTAKDVSNRQIAVATYLIDKLALRAGNEKDDDEADTVGCCTLKVGNVECVPPNKLKFDFLGKDSIQYVNTVEVEPLVYKAIGQFRAGKSNSDDLFDELDTSKLNAHLKELVPGLTAKVFRTYNASITLDVMLRQETREGDVNQKVVVYQQANKEVAIICNHQRTVSKSHGAQIQRLAGKIEELKEGLKELKNNLERAIKGKSPLEGSDGKKTRNITPEAWEKKIAQQMMKIEKMERDMQTKEDLKTVALGTSKINYMDPRITVAWCKRHEVPIEKRSKAKIAPDQKIWGLVDTDHCARIRLYDDPLSSSSSSSRSFNSNPIYLIWDQTWLFL